MSAQPLGGHFGDRLADAIAEHGPLCVGLDPYPDRIPAMFGEGLGALERFGEAVIDAVAGEAAALKPQIALFERFGPDSLAMLARLTERAREAGMIVILDAKRGDIGATAAGYAEAYLGPAAWLCADAVTVNPYMGMDTLEPWLVNADAAGKGVVVLVRTSNPGAAVLQNADMSGAPAHIRLCQALRPFVEARRGASGWSSVMAVVGATAPEEARAIREALPSAPFLVPGYGAQGAGAADALAGAVAGPQGLEGVLVNASRGVLYPPAASAASSEADWRAAIKQAVAAAQADLALTEA